METLYVQFQDSSNQVIVSYFTCSQDLTYFSNQGTVTITDPRWLAYYDAQVPGIQAMLPVSS
jgi:hypothetical protein